MIKKNLFFNIVAMLLIIFSLAMVNGCGSGSATASSSTSSLGGGSGGSNGDAVPVGNGVCISCHTDTAANRFQSENAGKDEASKKYQPGDAVDTNTTSPTYCDSNAIAGVSTVYTISAHDSASSSSAPACESCHGNGGQHYGTGPIPDYSPGIAKCGQCHKSPGFDLTAFEAVRHANPNSSPDQYFSQGGVGTGQATISGNLEYKSDGVTAVTINENIEECSACHNPSTIAGHIADNDVPNPPTVRCSSCHDPHMPAAKTRNYVATRPGGAVDAASVVNFKPQRVNNAASGAKFGAKNLISGTWIRPRMYYQYNEGGDASKTYSGYTNQGTSAADWLRLSPERLCASCHTKGSYKYGAFSGATAITGTHNQDIFTQFYTNTSTGHVIGHTNHEAPPWEEFSLLAALGSSHRPQYPFDMGKTDGGIYDGLNPNSKNNYACNQCHHGIGSIDYQKGVQGGLSNSKPAGQVPNGWGDSSEAHILWGDSTVTCITCHDQHSDGSGTTANIRVPKYLSYNTEFLTGVPNQSDYAPSGSTTPNKRGGVYKFMDLTDIPSSTGNSIICLFCHQGRESGWTVWNKVRRTRVTAGDSETTASNFIYNSGNTSISSSFSFINAHYLGGGSLLWSRNTYEYADKSYSEGIPQHQTKNCTGCHMAAAPSNNSAGGHTWTAQVSTCQECHTGVSSFHSIVASQDYNGSGAKETVYNEIGELSIIPYTGQPGYPGHGAAVYGLGLGGTGLFGLLNEALWDAGIEYDPATYPYFFQAGQAHTSSKAYKIWTPNQMGAAFNIGFLYKTGAPTEQAMYVHNAKYTVQILIDSLGALPSQFGQNYTRNPNNADPSTNQFYRPAGDRAYTNYRTKLP